jgi:hypothetical protein
VVLLVCGIVFAETGLLVGFFLPGDSMLFTAGLLVATDTIKFNIWLFAAADRCVRHHRQPDGLSHRVQGGARHLQQAGLPALQARER